VWNHLGKPVGDNKETGVQREAEDRPLDRLLPWPGSRKTGSSVVVMEHTLETVEWMAGGEGAEVYDTYTVFACVIALRLKFPASCARDRYYRSA
jgi:hypothetical protein